MQDVHLIDSADEAHELLKPIRIEILSQLKDPHSCPEIAKTLGLTTQKVYYHVKVLEDAGMITKVSERRVRGIMEGVFQAVARSFWFSPRLVNRLGGQRQTNDQASLTYLLQLAEELQLEIGEIAEKESSESVASIGLNGTIELKQASDRHAFLKELQDTFSRLAEKYSVESGEAGTTYRLMLACYPQDVGQKSKVNQDRGDESDE